MGDNLFPEYSEQFLEDSDHEKKWLAIIQQRVEELLEKDPGLLFSHLYRLDVEESILQTILKNVSSDQLPTAISEEIWKRQKARIMSRKNNPQGWILDSDF
ncbi:MAG: hypothetical protein WBO44_11795 [Saprospiraceae bacterium]